MSAPRETRRSGGRQRGSSGPRQTGSSGPRETWRSGAGLRRRRQERGLTQTELAGRAGVSRQLVAAVETGRNAPSVDAALRLARALNISVEELFGEPAPRLVPAVDDRLPDGAALRVVRVADQLVGSRLADHGIAGAGWARADGVWERGRLRLFPGAHTEGLAVAGCEPAFGIAEQMLAGLGTQSLVAIPAPTGRALAALKLGRVHAAVVHDLPERLPAPDEAVKRIHVARWQVGLGVPGELDRDLEAILLEGVPVVQRDPSASVQQALRRACQAIGAPPPPVEALAAGHLESARLAAIRARPGLATEAAARAFGLRFLPFEEHVVELWLGEHSFGHPGAEPLLDLLASAAFTTRVAGYGGYDLAGCGTIVRT